MTLVEANISVSLDGYVTGPGVEQTAGLGEGGEALHAWVDDEQGRRLLDDDFAAWGAVITSRRVYEDTGGWGEDGHLLPPHPSRGDAVEVGFCQMPVFVVTHRPHEPVVKSATTFTFVTDGIAAAVIRAAEAAGDKLVSIMGGASIIRQAVDAGLVDRLRLNLAPVLLGSGTRLFRSGGVPARLQLIAHQDTPHAAHLTYQVVR
jgi:dihydrofolate reductase